MNSHSTQLTFFSFILAFPLHVLTFHFIFSKKKKEKRKKVKPRVLHPLHYQVSESYHCS